MHRKNLSNESVKEIYRSYTELEPLDLRSNNSEVDKWRQKNQFNYIDFSMLVSCLLKNDNLDDFIKNSSADFDNLAPVIQACIRKKIVSIVDDNKIIAHFENRHSNLQLKQISQNFCPNNTYNQFPCDSLSVQNRINLILERYPFVPPNQTIAFLGDDDQIAINLDQLGVFNIEVYEIDERIVQIIEHCNSERMKVRSTDLTQQSPPHKNCDTFMTDPPYTLHGALLFIMRGLETLKQNTEEKEFYVILNKTMVGKSWYTIINILSQADVHLIDTRKNFSHYKMPQHFGEAERAQKFCREIGMDDFNIPNYSSSSDLFIFRTSNPNIELIDKFVDINLIYKHYD